MKSIVLSGEYFNIKDTVSCGQLFRYRDYKDGYLIFSLDKCCYAYQSGDNAVIECEDTDVNYFTHYFDIKRDYGKIYFNAQSSHYGIVKKSSDLGKGIRILNQDNVEALFSFIISQNNNIPRIKGIIEKLCKSLGEEKKFKDEIYYTFPSIKAMSENSSEFYKSIGLGYRAEYIYRLAKDIENGLDIKAFANLETEKLTERLIKIYGVGKKVADCVTLFGFHRSDSFPVDTWIEKVYVEDFNGKLTDRKKIAKWFTDEFKQDSGYIQQYLFYYKRSLEKNK